MGSMRRLLSRASAVLVLCVAAVATATVVVRADLDTLTKHSDLIVDATVKSKTVAFDAAGGSIWTEYRLTVHQTLLGELPETLVVSAPGGEVAGLIQEMHGAAAMIEGQRAALFLENEAGRYLVLGEAQGCLTVKKDAKTGRLVCRNQIHDLLLVDETGSHVDAKPLRIELVKLKAHIAKFVEAREARRREQSEALAKRLAALRVAAERSAELSRGKPGGAE